MDFANRLRQRRKFLKLTQVQLAEAAGMTQQMVQQLEARKVLTTGKILALAGALGVRPEWLVIGEEPITPNTLPQDEQALLADYRATPPDLRPLASKFVAMIRETASSYPAKPASPNESMKAA